jgi:hypothetical protein
MKNYVFYPDVSSHEPRDDIRSRFTEESFTKERAIYGGSLQWTSNNADPITQSVLNALLQLETFDNDIIHHATFGYHPVIDTRVTMMINENFTPVDLMGEELEMYQAIAGWHCDGVPRKRRGAQPDLDQLQDPIYHYVFSLSSTEEQVSPTGIINEKVSISIDTEKGQIWDQVNKSTNKLVDARPEIHTKLDDGIFTRFNRQTIHCSHPSKVRGFRYFFRCSFYHMPAMNEFRANNNVYLVPKGW